MLRIQFKQAFLIEMDPALMPVALRLQLQTALLSLADLMVQFREPAAKLMDLVFAPQNVLRTLFNFPAELFDGALAFGNLSLKHVELVPGELSVQMLQLDHQGLVTARFAGLALERANLPLHLANQVRDAQEVLIGVLQFAKRLFLL